MMPVRILYTGTLTEEQRKKSEEFEGMMEELKKKGFEYLAYPGHVESTDARFVPYRRLLEAFFRYSDSL